MPVSISACSSNTGNTKTLQESNLIYFSNLKHDFFCFCLFISLLLVFSDFFLVVVVVVSSVIYLFLFWPTYSLMGLEEGKRIRMVCHVYAKSLKKKKHHVAV